METLLDSKSGFQICCSFNHVKTTRITWTLAYVILVITLNKEKERVLCSQFVNNKSKMHRFFSHTSEKGVGYITLYLTAKLVFS